MAVSEEQKIADMTVRVEDMAASFLTESHENLTPLEQKIEQLRYEAAADGLALRKRFAERSAG